MAANGSVRNLGNEFSDDDFGHSHGHGHSHSHGDHHHHDHHHHDFDNDSIITPSISDSDIERLRDMEEMDEEEEEISKNINHVHHIVNRVRRRGYPDKSSTATKPKATPTVQSNGPKYKYLLLILALLSSFIIGYFNCSAFSLPIWPFVSSNSSSLPVTSDRIASQQASEKLNQQYLDLLNSLKGELDGTKERLSFLAGENERLRSAYADLAKKPCCNQDETINHSTVQQLIDVSLAKYDADKTGLPDFALESAGGTVVNIRCSETFRPTTSEYRLMGIPVWRTSNSPRVVIHPSVSPGECWAFHGSEGHIVIKLARKIVPTAFSYEHAPKTILPDGAIQASPKDFRVFGLANETDVRGHLLGHYTYDVNGVPLQMFPKQNPQKDFYEYIEVRILNNHGNPDYTCLYRFRVHGIISL